MNKIFKNLAKDQISEQSQPQSVIKDIVTELLPSTVFLRDENPADFEKLYNLFVEEIDPRDLLEHIFVREFVEELWEGRRFRRIKCSTINAARQEAIERIFCQFYAAGGPVDIHTELDSVALAESWITRDERSATADSILKDHGIGEQEIQAICLVLRLSELECIDRLINGSLFRREKVHNSLRRHRDDVRKAVSAYPESTVSDADFVEASNDIDK